MLRLFFATIAVFLLLFAIIPGALQDARWKKFNEACKNAGGTRTEILGSGDFFYCRDQHGEQIDIPGFDGPGGTEE